jgi:membrane-bound ClpP family serine protease
MRTVSCAFGYSVWLFLGLTVGLPTAHCAETNAGLVLPIAASRVMETAERLPTLLEKPLLRFEKERGPEGGRFWLICDFNPEEKANSSDNYGGCYELARRLRDLQGRGIQTVAFLHAKVSGHLVLPVLACSQIVMASEPMAFLGPVVEPGRTLLDNERTAYEEFARNRYPLVLVQKMYDRNLAVVRVPGARPMERFQPASKGQPGNAIADLGLNQTASYDFPHARDYGLCQRDPRNSIAEVLNAYGLPRSVLAINPDLPVVWQMTLSGPISGELKERVQRHVRRALGQRANVLILKLECGDGDSQRAYELGSFLAELNDARPDHPVETIAYLTPNARNTAAFLGLGCDKIVMHPEAQLGGFDRYLQDHPTLQTAIANNLADLAERKHYPRVLARGLADPALRIVWAQDGAGGTERVFLDERTFLEANAGAEQKNKEPRWRLLSLVKPARQEDTNRCLTLSAVTASELGMASLVTDSPAGIYEMVGVAAKDVHTSESDFLDDLAEFLRHPYTRVVLVMIGIACLILEMKIPGVSLPGVIAAICFVLFFWSHSQVHGQITVLALLLFLLGLVLIALEIFVIPGFAACGIGGILLVLGSLGLVAYGQMPRTSEEWSAYARALGPMGLSVGGAIVLAFTLARFLPSIPLANQLFLKPSIAPEAGEGFEDTTPLAPQPEVAALLGAIGVAATPLRPAGKVQFGEIFLDVIAEGGYVQPGARLQVIEIEGNRVVVKEV